MARGPVAAMWDSPRLEPAVARGCANLVLGTTAGGARPTHGRAFKIWLASNPILKHQTNTALN
jgi:hypothetical protein